MCLPLEVCCCCVRLEVAAKVVGVLHMVISSVTAVAYGAVAATLSYLPPARRQFYAHVSVAGVAALLLTCLMTYGAYRRKPRFLWPWVVLAWFSSVVLVGMAILGTVLLTFPTEKNSTSEISTMISVYFIYAVTLYYSASVVNSRRLEMIRLQQVQPDRQLGRQRDVPKSLLYENVV